MNLAIARMKLLQNKRDMQLKHMKKEIAQFLQAGQEPIARIRVPILLTLYDPIVYVIYLVTRNIKSCVSCVGLGGACDQRNESMGSL